MSKRPNPGALRHKITVEQLISTPDGYGGQTEAWAPRFTAMAMVEHVRSAESVISERKTPVETILCVTYNRNVSYSDRLLYDGRVYDINSISRRDERREFVWIEAVVRAE